MLDTTSFFASLSVIIVSELGDKTFFIAAIMAMSHSRVTVFLGAISALILMTLLSVCLGLTTNVITNSFTHYISIILFLIFGVKMLWEARNMSGDEGQEEYKEVEKSLEEKRLNTDASSINDKLPMVTSTDSESAVSSNLSIDSLSKDPETGLIHVAQSSISSAHINHWTRVKRICMRFVSLAFLETFSMTFVAEWGDRSQMATIILAAREDPFSVTIGAIIGHAICSMIAVIGGRIVAQMISVKTVTYLGGVIFVGFALLALLLGD